jgi:hypothetical protein
VNICQRCGGTGISDGRYESQDRIFTLHDHVLPELWERPDVQERVRKTMRNQLAIALMEQDMIPVSAPVEIVQERVGRFAYGEYPFGPYIHIELRIRVRPAPPFHWVVRPGVGEPYVFGG